jgi:hypothetical protein
MIVSSLVSYPWEGLRFYPLRVFFGLFLGVDTVRDFAFFAGAFVRAAVFFAGRFTGLTGLTGFAGGAGECS